MASFDEDLIADLQEDWEAGMSLEDMAKKHNYASPRSLSTRLSQLRAHGYLFELREREDCFDTPERRKQDKKLIKLIDKGKSRVFIANELGLTAGQVNGIILRLIASGDLPEDTSTRQSVCKSEDENQLLIAAYKSKAPLRQIASRFGFKSANVVSIAISRLRDQGYDVGPPRQRGGSRGR